jgi:DNA-binding transcriptional MerR regulator
VTTQDPAHLSIGEVLAELRDEFPDITISKIRFLESQGLVNPERTPSGYRKFYEGDLTRLRWILHQQKVHFLPLKVIKERLDQVAPGDEALLEPTPPANLASETPEGPSPVQTLGTRSAEAPSGESPRATGLAPARAAGMGRRAPARTRNPAFAPNLPIDDGADDGPGPGGEGSYSRAELASAAGLDDAQLAELESFGLVGPAREVGGEDRFDDDALEVARIASGFFRRGVEARHLRMYRTNAEREAVLFGQLLLPYVRQRNPEARARMQEELLELATLGRRLRAVLLREAVRESLAE